MTEYLTIGYEDNLSDNTIHELSKDIQKLLEGYGISDAWIDSIQGD